MPRRTAETYLILAPGKYHHQARVVDHRNKKPLLKPGQIAVKINVVLPPGTFDEYIPEVEVTLPKRGPATVRAEADWSF